MKKKKYLKTFQSHFAPRKHQQQHISHVSFSEGLKNIPSYNCCLYWYFSPRLSPPLCAQGEHLSLTWRFRKVNSCFQPRLSGTLPYLNLVLTDDFFFLYFFCFKYIVNNCIRMQELNSINASMVALHGGHMEKWGSCRHCEKRHDQPEKTAILLLKQHF